MSGAGQQHMTASQLSKQYQSVLKPSNKPDHEISQVTSTDDKYEVKLSIHEFEPHELSVKVVDRYVHVEGRHEEKNDKIGFFTRKFTRSYFLPEGALPDSVRCTFNIDTKLLTVTAPLVHRKPPKEYVIPVVIVGSQPASYPAPRSHSQPAPTPREREERGSRGESVPKTPSKKSKVPKASAEEKAHRAKKEQYPPLPPEAKTPQHSAAAAQQQTVHYAQIQHHPHHTHHHHHPQHSLPPPPTQHHHQVEVVTQHHHVRSAVDQLPPPPPPHSYRDPQPIPSSHGGHSHQPHTSSSALLQQQHSKSEHQLTAAVRQHSAECAHHHARMQPGSSGTHPGMGGQAQAQMPPTTQSTSAPSTATRPHRPKQQYPDHQEIDRLLLQQLMEQQARQRMHQQQQQQLYQFHQQQYQQHYQTK